MHSHIHLTSTNNEKKTKYTVIKNIPLENFVGLGNNSLRELFCWPLGPEIKLIIPIYSV